MHKIEASTTAQLLQQKGLEHEAAYLQQLKDAVKSVVEIPKDRKQLTPEAMQSGMDVIYQAVFFAPPQEKIGLRGDADFLIKCDTPSELGDFSY